MFVGELYCGQGFKPFLMWHRVVWWVFADIAKDDGAFETAPNTYVTSQQCIMLLHSV